MLSTSAGEAKNPECAEVAVEFRSLSSGPNKTFAEGKVNEPWKGFRQVEETPARAPINPPSGDFHVVEGVHA